MKSCLAKLICFEVQMTENEDQLFSVFYLIKSCRIPFVITLSFLVYQK